MKKFILTLAVVACAICSYAQTSEEILKQIETAPVRSKDFVTKYTEVRTPADRTKQPVTLTGELCWKTDGFVSMFYDNGDKTILNGNTMTVIAGGNSQVFDLTKNLMMKGLAGVIRNAFAGRLTTLATEQDAEIKAVKEGSDYVVTMIPRKKTPRGASQVVLHFKTGDLSIRSMQIDEVTGQSTFYSVK